MAELRVVALRSGMSDLMAGSLRRPADFALSLLVVCAVSRDSPYITILRGCRICLGAFCGTMIFSIFLRIVSASSISPTRS